MLIKEKLMANRIENNLIEWGMPKPRSRTLEKVLFWTGAFFAGAGSLAAGGLLIQKLSSYVFELKITAVSSSAVGNILMVVGHTLQKQKLKNRMEVMQECLNDQAIQLDPENSEEKRFFNCYIKEGIPVTIDLIPPYAPQVFPQEGGKVSVYLLYSREKRAVFFRNHERDHFPTRLMLGNEYYTIPNTTIARHNGRYYISFSGGPNETIIDRGTNFCLDVHDPNGRVQPMLIQEIKDIVTAADIPPEYPN